MKYILLTLVSAAAFAASPEWVCSGTEGKGNTAVTTTLNLYPMAVTYSYHAEIVTSAPNIRVAPTFGSMTSNVITKNSIFAAKGALVDGKTIALDIPLAQPKNVVKGRLYGSFVNEQSKLSVHCDKNVPTAAAAGLTKARLNKIELSGNVNLMPGPGPKSRAVDAKFDFEVISPLAIDEKDWSVSVKTEDGVNYVKLTRVNVNVPVPTTKPGLARSFTLTSRVEYNHLPYVIVNPTLVSDFVKAVH